MLAVEEGHLETPWVLTNGLIFGLRGIRLMESRQFVRHGAHGLVVGLFDPWIEF